ASFRSTPWGFGLRPFPSRAMGVGSSFCTAEGSIRSPDEPRWFGPPFVPSVALGVGSSEIAVRRSWPPEPCFPAPFVSEVRGVGSSEAGEDEDALTSVRGADVGSSYKPVASHVPERGQALN